MFCAECKRKSVYIDSAGHPAEFCSNQCRKAAVEQRHVQPCIKCRSWPMVRLPDGSRSLFCGKQCQNSSIIPPIKPPMPLQQPPYRPTMMTQPQLNQPNPPIGMPPHPLQLVPGGGRPVGGPWVMTAVPFCRNCQMKPCWKDDAKQTYSSYCSRRCRETAEKTPRVVSGIYNTPPGSATSPISPVLQTNGILSSPQGGNVLSPSQGLPSPQGGNVLSSPQGGNILPSPQGGNILPSPQGGNILPSPQGGNVLPPSQGGNMSRHSLYHQQQQPPYQPNNIHNVQQQPHLLNFQQQQFQNPQNNIQQPQFQNPQNNIQQPQLPQNPSNNIQYPRPLPSENPSQSQTNDNQINNNSQRQRDNDFNDFNDFNDLKQSQTSDSSRNGHHLRYHDTITPISQPQMDSQSSDNQTPPPIPSNKPTLIHPRAINITINTSQSSPSQKSLETHPRSPPSPPPRKTETRPRSPPSPPPRKTRKTPDYQSQSQVQVQEQNQLHSSLQQSSQSQVQEQNRPLSQTQLQSQNQPRSPLSPRLLNQPQLQSQLQSQPQSQNQPQSQGQSQLPSQPQTLAQQPNHSQPQPQSDGLHPETNDDSFMITPYNLNPEAPPPYTPNDAYASSGDRKVTRDDSFDESNPYGFREVNNNNSNVQDQNNNQPNYNQEQRTQRNLPFLRRS